MPGLAGSLAKPSCRVSLLVPAHSAILGVVELERFRKRVFALAYVAPLILAACAGSSSPAVPSAASMSSASLQRSSSAFEAGDVVSPKPPNIAGTYAGAIIETIGSQFRGGSLTVMIAQRRSSISGPFIVTFGRKPVQLTLVGTVKRTKMGAKISFTIENPNGANATGTGTVISGLMNGTAIVPPSGSQPQVNIWFKAKKQ